MTYRERYLWEHPGTKFDFISANCPEPKETECPFAYDNDRDCVDCWNRVAPPRKVKPRRKEHEKTNG